MRAAEAARAPKIGKEIGAFISCPQCCLFRRFATWWQRGVMPLEVVHSAFALRGFLYYEPQFFIMKKLSIFIASFAILLLTASAFADKRFDASLGNESPEFVLSDSTSTISLNDLKGKWVVLSFWSASDAVSRVAVNEASRYNRSLSDVAKKQIEFVSVNFDRSERLMHEVVRLDNLNSNLQFHLGDSNREMELRDMFNMHSGLRTFIINPEGTLVAADPSYERLKAIIG
jgi:peroxiredoxin